MIRRIILLVAALAGLACRQVRHEGPDVLLVILDTVRPDHLGCYGYSRDTSPVIDSLGASGTVFSDAVTQAPWTVASHASIFTGLTPQVHRSCVVDGQVYGLDPELPTIPVVMHDAGYDTFGEFSLGWFSDDFGYQQGFDVFKCFSDTERHAFEIVDDFSGWLDSLPPDRHFFALLHFYEAHAPYNPPSPYDSLFPYDSLPWPDDSVWLVDDSDSILHPEQLETLVARYDGEIRLQDDAIGLALEAVRREGRADDFVIVIIADHGEEFLEHGGYSHGQTLYQEVLRVPLIVSGTGIPSGMVRSELVGLIDVFPTILRRAGLEIPEGTEGADLFADFPADRYIPSSHPKGAPLFSIRRGALKLILDPGLGSAVTYDLDADPLELNPLPPDSALMEALIDYMARAPRGNGPSMSVGEIDESLRGLGYFN